MSLAHLREVSELRLALNQSRLAGRSVAVVPTMGALHRGHQELVRWARTLADEVAVTIFVNPTQFGPGEDFDRYPRPLEADLLRAREAGATLVFAPSAREMYPPGEDTRVQVGRLAEGLCGASRPGHFVGVATVVAKFFSLFAPATFVFGQKDYQQLKVIERMATDLLYDVRIASHPIVREPDGLALSSRNVYLSQEERKAALGIPRALHAAASALLAGERNGARLLEIAESTLGRQALAVEYVELRDADSLEPRALDGEIALPTLLAIAARSGATRLIDNIVLGRDAVPEVG